MHKTVVITGASSGIGAAMATYFHAAGYQLVLAGRDQNRLNAVSKNLTNTVSWAGDLSLPEACNALIAYAIKTYGRIDVLINSAGVIHLADAASTSNDMWRQTMAVNLDAPFYLSRAAIPHLITTKGTIINIASDWGLKGGVDAAAYCASKGGLVLLTKAMALDHAKDGVRVNAICPGDVDTPMLQDEARQRGVDYKAAMQANHSDSPTGRITRPEEVAALALYLASPVAAQITGTAIPIDGGNSA